jgi:hypothetical protein
VIRLIREKNMATATTKRKKQTKLPTTQPYKDSLEHLLAGLAAVDLRIRWGVMRARANGLNPDDTFRGLYISENQVDALLQHNLGPNLWPITNGDGQGNELNQWAEAAQQARAQWLARTAVSRQANIPLRLDQLRQEFNLSDIEVDILLLALAPELDVRYQRLFAYLQDDVTQKRPSVDLILNLLCTHTQDKINHRHLFTQDGRLIQTALLETSPGKNNSHPTLLGQYVQPAASVVEHLLGHSQLDGRLISFVDLIATSELEPSPWLPNDFIHHLVKAAADHPIFAFLGGYGVGKQAAALQIAQSVHQLLLEVNLRRQAESGLELEEAATLLGRDGRLLKASLYFTHWDNILKDNRPPRHFFQQLLDYPGIVIVAGEQQWQPLARQLTALSPRRRLILRVEFERPDYDGRLRIWRHYLGEEEATNLHGLANQFRFTPGQIEDAVATAHDFAHWAGRPVSDEELFAASRAHSNQNLATLATKIRPRYTWDDIILPRDTYNQLQEMVNIVQQQHIVYERWGFGRKLALGKGLSVLFSGHPGTGKTMAADIMAGALGLDLYKVDLSTVVSKYIGETEKNLNRIFTEAATSNAILFFDEADAIFGKRSEVKDSHDRYANIEISFLLQRMEVYDGVVILATNLQANLDEAFTRRFHFITEFPFPETADRERIWHVNVPPETPVDPRVDFGLLARRFRIAGGNIRNIILAAAFLAARDDQPMQMPHLLHATRREYQKMGRLIDEALFMEIRD